MKRRLGMSSRLICSLLVDEYTRHSKKVSYHIPEKNGTNAWNAAVAMADYVNFIRQEARSKKLRGRTGYIMALREIQR